MNHDVVTPLLPATGDGGHSPNPPEVLPDYSWTRDPAATRTRIKELARLAFPGYRGRTYSLTFAQSYRMENYWDGGTRAYAMAVNLATREVMRPSEATTTPFNPAAGAEFDIPLGFGIIEHCIFCGKSLGIRLFLPPLNPPAAKEVGQ